ncbi:MAG TPA: MarR family winged helix-turn-helix transcriptional regulator [Casimicrobium sp.]|mgnify:CR=1 FL=1|jgi:DNA-binding MarR family transcriptional regulator|nr:MarR family winged helix-turn-helix transcriptional regulator [Casimicrobium sp.]
MIEYPLAKTGTPSPLNTTGNTERPSDDVANLVLRDFRVLLQSARAHFAQIRSCTGLTGAQLWALSEVAKTPDLRLTSLARRLNVHQSTASNLVNDLLEKQLVRKVADQTDRRSINLQATPEGISALMSSPMPFEGVLPAALRDLSPDELRALQRALRPLMRRIGHASAEQYAFTPLSTLFDAAAPPKD